MKFEALEVALRIAQARRLLLDQIRRHDPDLADQARRATTSGALSISEARSRIGRDRARLFRLGLGSVSEVHTSHRSMSSVALPGQKRRSGALRCLGERDVEAAGDGAQRVADGVADGIERVLDPPRPERRRRIERRA